MDKKTIIAIALSLGVLFGYPYVMGYLYPSRPQVAQKTGAVDTVKDAVSGAGTEAKAPDTAAEPMVEEKLTAVETPLFRAVYTDHGAGVKSFVLKKYEESIKEGSQGINIAESIAINGSYSVRLASTNGAYEDLIFSLPGPVSVPDGQTAELVFTAKTATGLTVVKKQTVSAENYIVKTDLSIINSTNGTFQGGIETVLSSNVAGKDKSGYHTGPIVQTNGKLVRQYEEKEQLSGQDPRWIGIESKYFLAALLPITEVPMKWVSDAPSKTASSVSLRVPLNLPPSTATNFSYNSFLGPKEYDLLVNQKLGLEESIEFGYFSFMAKPTLVALNFFERFLGNYGIAIILMTVLIKIAFYPLSKHSLKSMREMQNLQPQLAAIKEKYKDNKDKMNKELMEMYKRYKVNPLGGCLPMVLQIPVFIALYEVLYVAIELRHAPFFLWLRDLSDKDPYYITPLIMGATMFLQQKMTPSTMDPAQAKIMLLMPVIFTFMFLNFPSGLVLYWLVNNVLTIAQQYYIQRTPSAVKA